MREILFRGKRVDNGRWVDGYYVYDDCGQITENPTSYIVHLNQHPCGWDTIPYEVIPETVGQYTGLTDKNDTKIFEGDIVEGVVYWQERPKNGVVAFRDGSFGLIWHRGDVEQFNPFTSMCNVEYEVIGNIHDNPELLEVGNNA